MSNPNLKLSADVIYNQSFSGAKSGYNCLQVDTLLDSIITDYETFDSYVKDQEVAIAELQRMNKILNEKITSLQVENTVMKQRLDDLKDVSATGSQGNLELLKRINDLETALYKAGGDPTKIK